MNNELHAQDIVTKLNNKINETYEGGLIPTVCFSTDGKTFKIQFFGELIYDSEDDHLLDDDLEPYIVEEINNYIRNLKMFKEI
jgi:hypothetical protein